MQALESTIRELIIDHYLCHRCYNLTGKNFRVCHHCKLEIDQDAKFEHPLTMDMYDRMLTGLIRMQPRSDTDTAPMITIKRAKDFRDVPELWQLYKSDHQYFCSHLAPITHQVIQNELVYIAYGAPTLPDDQYTISLTCGSDYVFTL